ncbi:MAG: sigma-70 family RNA polymerase sigma factor [Actinomycetota bacterium]
MSRSEPDDALVARYQSGDQAAFTALVQRHQTRVYNLALRMMGNREDAADATQDAFVHAFRKLPGFRGDSAFTTWMHRVTVNACYDILRKRKREPGLHIVSEDPGAPAREPAPPDPDHADEVSGSLDAQEALSRIPDDFRAVLVLADVHDLPFQEIAAILEIPVGTVKSRAHRGRIALAKAMGLDATAREPERAPSPSKDTP